VAPRKKEPYQFAEHNLPRSVYLNGTGNFAPDGQAFGRVGTRATHTGGQRLLPIHGRIEPMILQYGRLRDEGGAGYVYKYCMWPRQLVQPYFPHYTVCHFSVQSNGILNHDPICIVPLTRDVARGGLIS
jgi:hypothetical protein